MTWANMSGDPSSDERVLRDAQKTIERIVDAARSTLDNDVDDLRPEYEKLFGKNSQQFAMYQTLVSTFFQDHRMLTAVSKQLAAAEFVPSSNEPKRLSLMEIIANRFSQTATARENALKEAEAKSAKIKASPDWPNVQPVQSGSPDWPNVQAVAPRPAPTEQKPTWSESPVPSAAGSSDRAPSNAPAKPADGWQPAAPAKPAPGWPGVDAPAKDTPRQSTDSQVKPTSGWQTSEPPNPWQTEQKPTEARQSEPRKTTTGWQSEPPQRTPAAGWKPEGAAKTTDAWSNQQSQPPAPQAPQSQSDWQSKSQQSSSGGWANTEVQPSDSLNPEPRTGDWINQSVNPPSRPPSEAWPQSAPEEQSGTWTLKPGGGAQATPTAESAWPPPSANQGWPEATAQTKENQNQTAWGASAWPTQPVAPQVDGGQKHTDSAWPVQPVNPPPSQGSWQTEPTARTNSTWPPPESSGQGKWSDSSGNNKELPAAAWPATNSGGSPTGKPAIQKLPNGVIRPSWTAPIGESGQSGTWTLDRENEQNKQDSLFRTESSPAFPPSVAQNPVPPPAEPPKSPPRATNSPPTLELPKPAWNSQQGAESAPWIPSPNGEPVAPQAGWSPPRAEPAAWSPEPKPVQPDPANSWPSPPSQSGPTWSAPPAELTAPPPPVNQSWPTPPVTPQGGGFTQPIPPANPAVQPWSPNQVTPPKTPLPQASTQSWTPQSSNAWASDEGNNGHKADSAPLPTPSPSGVVHYQSQQPPPFPPPNPTPNQGFSQNQQPQPTAYQNQPVPYPNFEQPIQTNAAGVVQPVPYQNSPTQYPDNPDMPPPPPPRATGDVNQPQTGPGTLSGVLKQMRSFDNRRRSDDDEQGTTKYDPSNAW